MRVDLSDLPTMVSNINYVKRTDPPPHNYYAVEPPPGVPRSTLVLEPVTANIHDVSGHEDRFDLQAHGICYLRDQLDFSDYDNDEAIRTTLYPAVQRLARELLGVSRTVPIGYAVRRRDNGFESAIDPQYGAERPQIGDVAHCDFTPHSATIPLTWTCGAEGDRLSRGRFSIHNFWWPIRGPLNDYPLALCLPQSVAQSDFIELRTYLFKRGGTPIFGFVHHPDHQWIFKPGMRENDLMVFRTWDSGLPQSACVAHAAVEHRNAQAPILPRESIEVRIMSFYEEA